MMSLHVFAGLVLFLLMTLWSLLLAIFFQAKCRAQTSDAGSSLAQSETEPTVVTSVALTDPQTHARDGTDRLAA